MGLTHIECQSLVFGVLRASFGRAPPEDPAQQLPQRRKKSAQERRIGFR